MGREVGREVGRPRWPPLVGQAGTYRIMCFEDSSKTLLAQEGPPHPISTRGLTSIFGFLDHNSGSVRHNSSTLKQLPAMYQPYYASAVSLCPPQPALNSARVCCQGVVHVGVARTRVSASHRTVRPGRRRHHARTLLSAQCVSIARRCLECNPHKRLA